MDSPITPNDLKNLLSSLALSRGELADLLGVSKSTVDGWCSNKSIGKKRQQQLRVLILEHRLAAASESSDPSLEFFNGFKLGPSSYAPAVGNHPPGGQHPRHDAGFLFEMGRVLSLQ